MMNNENGRSMVEMLGVLAIIGVLSVAGIAGYSMAMKKYRANEIVNAASQLVVLAQAKYVADPTVAGGGTATNTTELGGKTAGYTITATCDGQGTPDCVVTRAAGDAEGEDWKEAAKLAGTTYYGITASS